MSEEEEIGVKDQETAVPESNSEEVSPSQVDGDDKPKEKSKEFNFAKLREKTESFEKKNQMLENEIKELKKAMESKNVSTHSVEEEELEKLDPDDILTVQQAKKLSEKQAKKIVQEMFEKQERASLPAKTKSQFSDFDDIMTKENIEKFEQEEPGLAEACAKSSNPWESTYKLLKKLIVPSQDTRKNEAQKKLEENEKRPGSLNSVPKKSPLSDANAWAEASKKELYAEMMRAARSYSS